LNIKPQKDGKGRYYIRVFIAEGNRPYHLLEDKPNTLTYQQAKKEAELWFNKITTPLPVIPLTNKPSISIVFYNYLQSVSGISEKTRHLTNTLLKAKFLPFFTDKPMEDVTALDIEKYKTYRLGMKGKRGKNIQGGSINRELSVLLSVINKSFRLHIIKTNPLAGEKIERLESNSNHGKYPQIEEWQKFIQVFSDKERVLREARKCCRIAGSEPDKQEYV